MIDAHRLAVVGSPIAHSLSPRLHRAAYARLGLPWQYDAFELSESQLAGFVQGRDDSWRGLSLTMPLKTEALRLASDGDSAALLTGSVNTLVPGSSWQEPYGYNTDVAGIERALRSAGCGQPAHVLVLGSGATAASACAAATNLGAGRVTVAARRPDRAARLRSLVEPAGVRFAAHDLADDLNDVDATVVVAALPGGAKPRLGAHETLAARSLLLDVAYDPWPSALARAWQRYGGAVLTGLAMLVHQAVVQVRIFYGGSAQLALPQEDFVVAAMLAEVGLELDGGVRAS